MSQNPIIKALGQDFSKLPSITQKHYTFNENLQVRIEGTMEEVYHNWYGGIFTFFGQFINAMVPFNGKNIPVQLVNTINEKEELLWERTFFVPNRKPYVFKSTVVYEADHKVIVYVKLGLGLVTDLEVKDGYLKYSMNKYILNIFGIKIPTPSFLAMGKGFITEKAIDNEIYEIDLQFNHPLFGKTFGFKGKFKVN